MELFFGIILLWLIVAYLVYGVLIFLKKHKINNFDDDVIEFLSTIWFISVFVLVAYLIFDVPFKLIKTKIYKETKQNSTKKNDFTIS